MNLHDLLLVGAGFVSEILGTLSGFGSSTFFVPAAVHLEAFHLVLALTAILHCFGNTSKIFLFRSDFKAKDFFRLAVPALIFAGLGAVLSKYFAPEVLKQSLGAALILIALMFLFGNLGVRKFPDWVGVLLCAVSGFTTGFVGTGGAIRGVALASMNLERGAFVVLSAAIDIGGDLLRLVIYLWNGYMDWNQWFYIPLLGIAAIAGARVGKWLLQRLSREQFEKIVAVFILLSGVLMIFE